MPGFLKADHCFFGLSRLVQRRVLVSASCFLGIVIPSLAFAEVPVVDVYAPATNTVATGTANKSNVGYNQPVNRDNGSQFAPRQPINRNENNPSADLPQVISPDNLTAEVKQLRQKVEGISQMDLLSQINTLQQEIRVLRGQVEVQNHKLQQLQKQQRIFSDAFKQRSQNVVPARQASARQASARQAPAKKIPAKQTPVQSTRENLKPSQAQAKPTSVMKASNSRTKAQVEKSTELIKEQQAYQNAYQLISDRKYSQAITAMQTLLKQYPKSNYVVNAHYWLGELYLIAGDTGKSRAEFVTVVNKYPDSSKVADALLKIGYLDYDQSKWAEAKAYLAKVTKKFPNSSSARLAKARLQKIAKLGY